MERNSLVEQLREHKVEYEFDLKRLKINLKEALEHNHTEKDKFQERESKLLEQNKTLLK